MVSSRGSRIRTAKSSPKLALVFRRAAILVSVPVLTSRSGELRMQKLKSHLVRTQSLNVLPFKPRVDQYIAIHATLTTRDFFLISALPVHSPAFFQNLSQFFPVLAVTNTVPV